MSLGWKSTHWYNNEHRHSGIRYVTPAQRHDGRDRDILSNRHVLYLQARDRHPRRWAGNTRDWSWIERVTLNPEKDSTVNSATAVGARETEQFAA